MTRNTESDETYCSDLEKEDRNPIRRRRSKRLSQRSLLPSFRSNEDPATQRLLEVYQMIKCGKLCSNWLYDEWQAQKLEIEIIKNTLKGKQKGRISFILKQINKHLHNSSSMNQKETPSSVINNSYENEKQVNSPNILAGMMTEVLTEIPPYQPENLSKITNTTVKNTEQPSIALTQRNPLDLTKKDASRILEAIAPDKVLSQADFSEKQIQQHIKPAKIKTPIGQQKSSTSRNTSRDLMIDLTEADAFEKNKENIQPGVNIKQRSARPKTPIHVSKWLKFLPTPERPTFPEKPKSTSTHAPRKDPKSFKDSLVNLHKAQPLVTTSIPNKPQNPLTSNYSKKPKHIEKCPPIRSYSNENSKKQKSYRNTENIISKRNRNVDLPPLRNVQSEHFTNISPNFLLDEFSDWNNDNESITPSCREGFKKLFGTDNLNDYFKFGEEIENHDEVVYKLKENHVKRLATILNVNHGTLKKTIEGILSNENFEDDNNLRSDSSVVECSQSPPQRLLTSQRSQISK